METVTEVPKDITTELPPKTETPAVVIAEEKKEVVEAAAEVQEKTFFETLSEKAPVVAATTEPAKDIVLPPEVQAKLKEAETYKQQLEAISQNPLAQAYAVAKDAQEYKAILKELQGVDYSNFSYEQLVRKEFEGFGLEGDKLKRAVDAKMSEFNSITDEEDYKRDILENQLRNKFPATQGESPTLQKALEAFEKKQQQQLGSQPTEAQMKELQAKELAAIKGIVDEYNAGGAEADFEQIAKHYNEKELVPYIDNNNVLDVKSFVFDKYVKNNLAKIIASERAAAVKEYQRKNAGLDRKTDTGMPAAAGSSQDQDFRTQKLGINKNLLGLIPIQED